MTVMMTPQYPQLQGTVKPFQARGKEKGVPRLPPARAGDPGTLAVAESPVPLIGRRKLLLPSSAAPVAEGA